MGFLILEVMLTVLICFLLIQLAQCILLEGIGMYKEGGSKTQENGFIRFRFKFVFWGMYLLNRYRSKYKLRYVNWDKNRISTHTFLFGLATFIAYSAVVGISIYFKVTYEESLVLAGIGGSWYVLVSGILFVLPILYAAITGFFIHMLSDD